jgi:DNA polymerase-1
MIIDTEEALDKVMDKLKEATIVAFDFETRPSGKFPGIEIKEASLHHRMLEIEGLAIRSDNLNAFYIPFDDTEISRLYLNERLHNLFSQDSLFVAHNIAFDAKLADYFFGARPKNKFCTLVGYWYIDENARKDKVTLYKTVFNKDVLSYNEAKKEDKFLEYVLSDADFAWNLYHYELEWFGSSPERERLLHLVTDLEMDFIDVLIDMALYGIKTDIEVLKQGEEILTEKAIQLEAEIYKNYGEFNLKSPMQLCEKIYGIKISRKNKQVTLEKLPGKYPKPTKMTKSKNPVPSTDDDALSSLNTPIARLIQQHRAIVKQLDTYAKGYQKWVIDGRIYPTFSSCLIVTGRLQSQSPSMQVLPREPIEGWWVRDAFIASEGYDLIVADESQLEIRLTAHFSKDENLIHAITSGEDVHTEVAKMMLGKKDISKKERADCKTSNFAVLYGLSAKALGIRLEMSKQQAANLIETYYETFPRVRFWKASVIKKLNKNGFIKNPLGRIRRIPDIFSSDAGIKSYAERQAVNWLPQGFASDIMKVAMVNMSKEFKEKGLDAHVLLQIHDEVVVEVKKDQSEQAAEIIKRNMEHPFINDLAVPLEVIPKICQRWSEGK